MSPFHRLLGVGLGLTLWFGWIAPDLLAGLEARRAAERIEPGALALASAIATARASLLPQGTAADQAARLLREAALDLAIDRTWTLRAGAVLNPSQRRDPGATVERPRLRAQPWLEPDLVALIDALGQQGGQVLAAPPDTPEVDPWPGVEPRRRVAALLALVPELAPEQQGALRALALDAALAQGRRAASEEALRDLLDPAVLQIAATLPGDAAQVDVALDRLRARVATPAPIP